MKLLGLAAASLFLLAMQWLALPSSSKAAPALTQAAKIRPYSGIGVLLLAPLPENADDLPDSPVLYEDPSVFRIGILDAAKVIPYTWIFGTDRDAIRLIVTSRKGEWLRVVYDEAGREAWLKHPPRARFLAWESFLKGHSVSLLPGLQKKYYQTSQELGMAPSGTIISRKPVKVIKVENDWALVMPDKEFLAWLRWRDEDGRLLIGFEAVSGSASR